ncbi:hypothetical protein Glove_74g120 [Diversispora epigaea]|uniref:B box-type domain-containing protein n=1 Tax=Diversispora epigaea TaxID=1348612 RepID=A0A397JKC5_9GLOM|nr:hypothetical protein Glove_74g120 [Diversispora epigaea]
MFKGKNYHLFQKKCFHQCISNVLVRFSKIGINGIRYFGVFVTKFRTDLLLYKEICTIREFIMTRFRIDRNDVLHVYFDCDSFETKSGKFFIVASKKIFTILSSNPLFLLEMQPKEQETSNTTDCGEGTDAGNENLPDQNASNSAIIGMEQYTDTDEKTNEIDTDSIMSDKQYQDKDNNSEIVSENVIISKPSSMKISRDETEDRENKDNNSEVVSEISRDETEDRKNKDNNSEVVSENDTIDKSSYMEISRDEVEGTESKDNNSSENISIDKPSLMEISGDVEVGTENEDNNSGVVPENVSIDKPSLMEISRDVEIGTENKDNNSGVVPENVSIDKPSLMEISRDVEIGTENKDNNSGVVPENVSIDKPSLMEISRDVEVGTENKDNNSGVVPENVSIDKPSLMEISRDVEIGTENKDNNSGVVPENVSINKLCLTVSSMGTGETNKDNSSEGFSDGTISSSSMDTSRDEGEVEDTEVKGSSEDARISKDLEKFYNNNDSMVLLNESDNEKDVNGGSTRDDSKEGEEGVEDEGGMSNPTVTSRETRQEYNESEEMNDTDGTDTNDSDDTDMNGTGDTNTNDSKKTHHEFSEEIEEQPEEVERKKKKKKLDDILHSDHIIEEDLMSEEEEELPSAPVPEGLCVECRDQEASFFCEQCKEDFCEVCFSMIHRTGSRREHVHRPLKEETNDSQDGNKQEIIAQKASDDPNISNGSNDSSSNINQKTNMLDDILHSDHIIEEDLMSEEEEELPSAPVPEGLCVECRDQEASFFCEQCKEDFCEVCFSMIHRTGSRREHVHRPLKEETNDSQDGNKQEIIAQKASDDPNISNGSNDSSSNINQKTNMESKQESKQEHKRASDEFDTEPEPTPTFISSGSSSYGDWIEERARYIPLRLSSDERKRLRLLEAALNVSEYTDKIDIISYTSKVNRIVYQIKDLCSILSGLFLASDYNKGQELFKDKSFEDNEEFFQTIFEVGRRHKIMNPEKMRDAYGKLMYLLMDSIIPEVKDLLQLDLVIPIKTVYDFLKKRDALRILHHELIPDAVQEIIPDGKRRPQINQEIRKKERAIELISHQFRNRNLSSEEIKQCLYSIGDNHAYLRSNRDCCIKMLKNLTSYFNPSKIENGYSLAIRSGKDGARLSHNHETQYHYANQTMSLWREIQNEMFKLWFLADEDLLSEHNPYRLKDTGQGLNRMQRCPSVSHVMHSILHRAQKSAGYWIGSSVIHLGDKNVPNALMFIDKYNQVSRILNPILICLEGIKPLTDSNTGIRKYIKDTFGSVEELKKGICADFFRYAFDGSGADNFFDAGSCIDGRLTSAWNWCSLIEKKAYFPVFLLTGFVGFDGEGF